MTTNPLAFPEKHEKGTKLGANAKNKEQGGGARRAKATPAINQDILLNAPNMLRSLGAPIVTWEPIEIFSTEVFGIYCKPWTLGNHVILSLPSRLQSAVRVWTSKHRSCGKWFTAAFYSQRSIRPPVWPYQWCCYICLLSIGKNFEDRI